MASGSTAAPAAREALRAARAMSYVTAVELMCAAEAVGHHRPLTGGAGIERAIAVIRERVPALTGDRPLTADVEHVAAMVRAGDLATP